MATKTYEIDATGQALGRIATHIATLLRGKNLASFEPNIQPDVKVVLKNIDKMKFTGTKLSSVVRHRHSGYPGGIYSRTLGKEWAKQPKEVVRKAVYRMLPTNRMRDKIINNLEIQ